ncbi:MAG: STAS domain-containing protein [Spirochaetia bacterium]|nr:STAS domain-containing protein [Spirochaetia bacterium]
MGSRLLAKAKNSIVPQNGSDATVDVVPEILPAQTAEHSSKVSASSSLRSKAGQIRETRESRTQAQHEYFSIETLPSYPDVLIVHPQKPIQIETVQPMHAELLKIVGASRPIVVWDFSTVENIDGAGVGMLIAIQKKLREQGGDQALAGLRPRLMRFVAMLGYADYFCIEPDIPHVLDRIEEEHAGIFPLAVTCPACGSGLQISEPGRGRCRSCGAILSIFSNGSIELG